MAQMLKSPPECWRPGLHPWVEKTPLRRIWQLTVVFLPGEFHGQNSLVGYSPQSHKDLGMTEQLIHMMKRQHFISEIVLMLQL